MQWLFLIILIPYIYLITKIYISLSEIKPFNRHTEPGTLLSVIVACRNEGKRLPLILSDIADQSYNPDLFELIVVDDNSSDSTLEVASEFGRIKNLKVLNSSGKGKKQAIRTGVEAATGTLIITTDADCRIGKNWLKTIASFQEEYKPEMIICPVKLEGGKGFFQRFQELEFLSLQGITAGTAVSGDPVMCNGAGLAFPRAEYLRHAGNLHDELASGDDVFLLHNIKMDRGKTIMWLESAEAEAKTRTSDNLLSFLRQRGRWISKTGAYSDRFTWLLAIVTFVTISAQVLLFVAGLFIPPLLWIFAAFFILKSIPDFLVLSNTSERYGKKYLMSWFIPSQLVYPFYVLSIIPCSLLTRAEWKY
ncbi:MAG: glycosyltransferase [Bacteroidia bacterium]|nr:MAG: glycosyltransferase [Bacteroidia bacterium]